ncbi:hypothetical protein [Pseudofrankia sp. DC12]|uniref:hypothetical protein n=1 Tax=Pseudofrankia sp. DC12 TaxID=683315 RepID=UPI0005F86ECC|nr:hypothetical protein [Pseudofrankia sp. DC12]
MTGGVDGAGGWDSFGQRLTGSGTTVVEGVEIPRRRLPPARHQPQRRVPARTGAHRKKGTL